MFFRILVTQIINPVDNDYIPWIATFQQKRKIRIFGNSGTHIAGGDGFAVMGDGQYLNVMRRNEFIGGFILVSPMLHGVGDESTDLGVAV